MVILCHLTKKNPDIRYSKESLGMQFHFSCVFLTAKSKNDPAFSPSATNYQKNPDY